MLDLSEDSGVANIKIVGELKVPWVEGHSLDAADENDHPPDRCQTRIAYQRPAPAGF